MLAIRLPADIEKRLDQLAKRTGRTKTWYVREAVLNHLEDLEDVYYAEKELIAIREGRSKTIPIEEVMKRYGLEDGVVPQRRSRTGRSRPPNRATNPEVPVRSRRPTRKSA
jgi:RHH-type transcriptional regulator, rel operon repressor / antitoxin RelB